MPERVLSGPVFAQPEPTPLPGTFKLRHPSDKAAYDAIAALNKKHKLEPMKFPPPRGNGPEPLLTLSSVFQDKNGSAINNITRGGRIVFHSGGDCGPTHTPVHQNAVAEKMVADFDESDPREIPQFMLLLGDVVYSFGETEYYYEQFYEPYRNYQAPILAAAGNHDGMVSPLGHATTLKGFLRNFCVDPAGGFTVTPEAGGLSRTAQIQPGVFFTLEVPFVRILVFYSNVLEDPGYIAHPAIGNSQLDFLRAALKRVKSQDYKGALIFAHHHPPYAIGGQHSSSIEMRTQMDKICEEEGVWPHAVLAGHAHSYQRFTRQRRDGTEIPYIVCGNIGHNVQRLRWLDGHPMRAPQVIQQKGQGEDQVTFERYDDINYGYLRCVASAQQFRIEYHPAADGTHTKAPDDSVTIDLQTRKRTTFEASDLGFTAVARKIRADQSAQARQAARAAGRKKAATKKAARKRR